MELARLSAWPYETSEALSRAVLRAVLTAVEQHVSSVLPLRGLPRDYLEAIGARLGGLGQVFTAALGAPPPEEVLSRIKPMLEAISLRVVIWLEDLDRFAERTGASTAAIRALLFLFTEVSGLSFVLAVARFGPAPSEADLGKLGLFVERIPELDPEFVVNVVRLFRKRRLAEEPFIDTVDRSKTDVGKMCDDSRMQLWRLFSFTLEHAIANAARTPRALKLALRRVREAWVMLRGEIDFDDILLLNLLRYSPDAIPIGEGDRQHERNVFELVTENIRWLRSRCLGHPYRLHLAENDRGEAVTPAEKALEALWKNEEFPLGKLFSTLFSTTSGAALLEKSPQRLLVGEPTDYFGRALKEELDPSEVRDQEVLRGLALWRRKRAGGSLAPSEAAPDVITWLAEEGDRAEKIEQFTTDFTDEEVMALCDGVARLAIEAPPSGDASGPQHFGGVGNCMRLLRRRYPSPEKRLPWMTRILKDAVQRNIRVANDVFYFWPMTQMRGDSKPYDDPSFFEECYRTMHEGFMAAFASEGDGERLLSALSAFPFDLRHLVLGAGDNRPVYARVPVEEWGKSADVLLAATEADPGLMLPRIAYLIVDVTEQKLTSAPGRPDEVLPVYEFNADRARAILSDRFEDFVDRFAEATPPSPPETPPTGFEMLAAGCLAKAIEEATRLRAAT